ncbi:tRNA modification GTPase MnmE [Fundidesulfovibrio magnetotacticus]|uniref:tRNA modification GTPase MnmE n=1 Tax=Fundidesulfovibrio magnetotacticus TaxID=2730080 RepID=A0A6V8LSF0_9BACT|nr:tRNA modification GTPase [Fundidesulfovibrio magnetotacticus]GFK95402.1 tRNA modification GTPase MnmE [Fundidesulfovibrio magnetotacticus]
MQDKSFQAASGAAVSGAPGTASAAQPADSSGGETIAAIVTAPGRGGVGIVRLSGPRALAVAQSLFRSARPDFRGFKPYRLHHGRLHDLSGRPLDDVLAAFMPGPGSYTGEDVAEFHCHGSPAVLRAVLDAAVALGARHARPGEYTLRAFLNGRMDLSQAQAVAELVAADSPEGARLALDRLEGLMGRRVRALRELLEASRVEICLAVDFPEDEVECLDPQAFQARLDEVMAGIRALLAAHERARPFREGASAVLAGPVNAGKSSLLNALVGRERALVSERAGTTRDFLEEQVVLDGLPVRLADTAGLRDCPDPVEREGLARGLALAREAALTLLVVDGSRPLDGEVLRRLPGAARQDPESGEEDARAPGDGQVRDLILDPARVLAVVNKADLPPCASAAGDAETAPLAASAPSPASTRDAERDPCARLTREGFECVRVSARTGQGLESLCARLRERILGGGEPVESRGPAPSERERALLSLALEELSALTADLAAGTPPDLLGVRLETACGHLSAITGEIAPDEVLRSVFDGFCIGK